MNQDLLQTLIHVVAVTFGLYVLWSLLGAMRRIDAIHRFYAALTAGLISGAVVLIVRLAA